MRGNSLSRRIVQRLVLSPVPVRTSVLAADLAAQPSRIWASLLRLERLGRLQRGSVVTPAVVCRCSECGSERVASRSKREATWQLKQPSGRAHA